MNLRGGAPALAVFLSRLQVENSGCKLGHLGAPRHPGAEEPQVWGVMRLKDDKGK